MPSQLPLRSLHRARFFNATQRQSARSASGRPRPSNKVGSGSNVRGWPSQMTVHDPSSLTGENQQVYDEFTIGMMANDRLAVHHALVDMRSWLSKDGYPYFFYPDHADAASEIMLADCARDLGLVVYRTKVQTMWWGHKDKCPSTLPAYAGDSLISRLRYYPRANRIHCILDARGMDGTLVLPALPDGEPRRYFQGLDRFIRKDFFPLEFDAESILHERNPASGRGHSVLQTWTVHALLIVRIDIVEVLFDSLTLRADTAGDEAWIPFLTNLFDLCRGDFVHLMLPSIHNALHCLYDAAAVADNPSKIISRGLLTQIIMFAMRTQDFDLLLRVASWPAEFCTSVEDSFFSDFLPEMAQNDLTLLPLAFWSSLHAIIRSIPGIQRRLGVVKSMPPVLLEHLLQTFREQRYDLVIAGDGDGGDGDGANNDQDASELGSYSSGWAFAEGFSLTADDFDYFHEHVFRSTLLHVTSPDACPLWGFGMLACLAHLEGLPRVGRLLTNRRTLYADYFIQFATDNRICSSVICDEDSEDLIREPLIAPHQLFQVIADYDNVEGCNSPAAQLAAAIAWSTDKIRGTAEFRHFWLPFLHLVENGPEGIRSVFREAFVKLMERFSALLLSQDNTPLHQVREKVRKELIKYPAFKTGIEEDTWKALKTLECLKQGNQ